MSHFSLFHKVAAIALCASMLVSVNTVVSCDKDNNEPTLTEVKGLVDPSC